MNLHSFFHVHCWHTIESPLEVHVERIIHGGYDHSYTTPLAIRRECCGCKAQEWRESGYDDYGRIDGKVTVTRP